jgi:hypothetical protein
MSAQGQAVQIEFKISSDSLNKLQKVMSGGSTGSSKSGGKGAAGLSSIMEKFSLGTAAKLGGIAIGVTAITGVAGKISKMLVQSSPMLQSMLKLLNTGIMMMLRPIGDFIGFLLRPLMIYLMRSVFLPWYRQMAPIMRVWGSELGAGIVAFVKDPFGTLADALADVTWSDVGNAIWTYFKDWTILGQILNTLGLFDIDLGEITSGISTKVSEFFDSISTTLTTWWSGVLEKLTTFRDSVSTALTTMVATITAPFTALAESLSTGFTTVVTTLTGAWESVTDFFVDTLAPIGTTLGDGLNSFITFISETLGGVGTTLDTAWNSFVSFFESIGNIWILIGKAWEDFIIFVNNMNPMNWGDAILDAGQNFVEEITNNSSKENNVNVEVHGGSSGGFGDDVIEGLKQTIFGWIEDNDTKG